VQHAPYRPGGPWRPGNPGSGRRPVSACRQVSTAIDGHPTSVAAARTRVSGRQSVAERQSVREVAARNQGGPRATSVDHGLAGKGPASGRTRAPHLPGGHGRSTPGPFVTLRSLARVPVGGQKRTNHS
jgi:hypothetical protein